MEAQGAFPLWHLPLNSHLFSSPPPIKPGRTLSCIRCRQIYMLTCQSQASTFSYREQKSEFPNPKCKNPLSSNLLVVGMVLGGPLLGGSLTHHHFLPPCIFTSPQPPMMPPPNCIKNNLNKLVFSLCNAFTVLRFKSLLGKSGSPLSKWVLGGWYTEREREMQQLPNL